MDTYDHNTQCHWHVHCPSGQVASFDFVHMDTERGFDFVSIFNGQANNQPSSSALLRASGAMSNLPATSVSLPFQDACNHWLTLTGMQGTVDTAAALCDGGGH